MNVQHIETLRPASMYSDGQIQRAFQLAVAFNRGTFVLCEKPYKL